MTGLVLAIMVVMGAEGYMVPVGDYEVTAYTSDTCNKAPGDAGYGVTRSGAPVEEGVTVAADWRVLPAGTLVYVSGAGYRVVQDTGGAINGRRLDLYMVTRDDALAWGRQLRAVWRELD